MAALLEKAGIKGGLVKELPRSINLRKPLPATLAAKVPLHPLPPVVPPDPPPPGATTPGTRAACGEAHELAAVRASCGRAEAAAPPHAPALRAQPQGGTAAATAHTPGAGDREGADHGASAEATDQVRASDNGVAIATLCSAVWPSLRILITRVHACMCCTHVIWTGS